MRGLPALWHEEADLVVVGSGAAGLTGAVVAAIEGQRVAVLEKARVLGGTSALSGGGLWVPLNHHMGEVGIEDSREEALAYVRACVGDCADDDVLSSLVDNAAPMLRFLEERAECTFRPYPSTGPTFDYHPELPGAKHGGRAVTSPKTSWAELGEWKSKLRIGIQSAWVSDKLDYFGRSLHAQPPREDAPRRHMLPGETVGEYLANGAALIAQLLKACLAHEVAIQLESPVERLVCDAEGRVVGAQARRGGEAFFVRARSGVLLATGGFAHNEELLRLWLDRPLLGSCEVLDNQGEGQLLGLAVGAQLAGIGDAAWAIQGGGPRQLPHTIIVNASGTRFTNEGQNYYDICHSFGHVTEPGGAANLPAWLVFDAQAAEKYETAARLARRAVGALPSDYQGPRLGGRADAELGFVDDNERLRYADQLPVVSAETLAGLAERVGIASAGLAATVARFNQYARAGTDPDFARGESAYDRSWGDPRHSPNPSLGVLERAPFFATPVYPGAFATKGGLRVNARAEVLAAASGAPIPGLFAAGNCSSSVYPSSYPGMGATLGPGMTFGYVAARTAAGLGDEAAASEPLEPAAASSTAPAPR